MVTDIKFVVVKENIVNMDFAGSVHTVEFYDIIDEGNDLNELHEIYNDPKTGIKVITREEYESKQK